MTWFIIGLVAVLLMSIGSAEENSSSSASDDNSLFKETTGSEDIMEYYTSQGDFSFGAD